MRNSLFVNCLCWLVLAGSASPLAAHVRLEGSIPPDATAIAEAPREVVLRFSEPIAPRFATVVIYSTKGEKHVVRVQVDDDSRMLRLIPPVLEQGIYSVAWQVMSAADGHLSRGVLTFGIGGAAPMSAATTAPVSYAELVVHGGQNVTVLLTLGALALPLWMFPRRVTMRATDAQARRVLRFVCACAGSAAIATAMQFSVYFYRIHEFSDSAVPMLWWELMSQTRFGAIAVIEFVIFVGIMGGCIGRLSSVRRIGVSGGEILPNLLFFSPLAVMLIALIALLESSYSHAAALEQHALQALAVQTMHVAAAGLWFGGLTALALWPRRMAAMQRAWLRFSSVAIAATAILVMSGLYNAGRHMGELSGWTSNLYGQALLAKLALFALVLWCASRVLLALRPTFAARLSRHGRSVPSTFAVVRVELAFALLVVLAASVMTATPTSRELIAARSASEPTTAITRIDDLVVTLTTRSNRTGPAMYSVRVASARRPAPAEILRVMLRFSRLDADLVHPSLRMQQVQPGQFVAEGNQLSTTGRWRIDAVIRRRGIEDSVASFLWDVPMPNETPARPLRIWGDILLWMFAIGGFAGVFSRHLQRPAGSIEGAEETGSMQRRKRKPWFRPLPKSLRPL